MAHISKESQALPISVAVPSSTEIAEFRNQGPKGIQTFLQKYKSVLEDASNPEKAAIYQIALDQVCQQKDCLASQLYWYTNLEKAKQAAKTEGKSILSLRLLGNLSTDLSCANSRFFRTTLYANAEISSFLHNHFILHWQSVRPVPVVSIDFGDGRVLKRTITGNSIHYVLDENGQVVDALPGLYGPKAFLAQLEQANEVVQKLRAPKEKSLFEFAENETILATYHQKRLKTIAENWRQDLHTLQIKEPQGLKPVFEKAPNAQDAARRAMSKMYIENPILRELPTASANQKLLERVTDEVAWKKIAQLHEKDAKLDQNSMALIQKKMRKQTKVEKEKQTLVISSLEESIALDTVRNTYLFQPTLYTWLLENKFHNVDQLNEEVYSKLFLTPSSDPWLGLKSPAYSALDGEGVELPPSAK